MGLFHRLHLVTLNTWGGKEKKRDNYQPHLNKSILTWIDYIDYISIFAN